MPIRTMMELCMVIAFFIVQRSTIDDKVA
jgi:hypothetical protein